MSERPDVRRVVVANLDTEIAPITITVKRFCVLSGLSRSTAWEMIRSGALRSVKIMGTRLIIVESYRKMVQQAESAE